MSLCPLSWKSVKRLNRESGEEFIAASAHNDGDVIGVTPNGKVLLVERHGKKVVGVTHYNGDTTTAAYLRGQMNTEFLAARISQDWKDELARRAEELDAATPA